MATAVTYKELLGMEGADLGYSEWLTVTQEQINMFADATNDHNWIHIDPERASAYLNRGIMRQQRQVWDRARQDFRTFLAMTARPDEDPSVIEARRRLEEVDARVQEEDAAAVERLRDS